MLPDVLSEPTSPSPQCCFPGVLLTSVLMPRIAPTQVQHAAFGFVEPHWVLVVPLCEPAQVPLDGVPSSCCIHCSTRLSAISKLMRVHSMPSSVSLLKMLKSANPLGDGPLGHTAHHQPPPGHGATVRSPPAVTIPRIHIIESQNGLSPRYGYKQTTALQVPSAPGSAAPRCLK